MHLPLLIAAVAAASVSLTAVAQAHATAPRHVHAVRHHAVSRDVLQSGRSVYIAPRSAGASVEPSWKGHWGF